MRFDKADPGDLTYLHPEPLLNNIKRVDINSGTEEAWAVAVVDSNGTQITSFGGANTATTATLSNVSDNVASQTLAALNTGRKGLIIFNDSSGILLIKFGTTASATDFTYRVNPFQTFEMLSGVIFTGRVDGIWLSDGGGAARVTELSA